MVEERTAYDQALYIDLILAHQVVLLYCCVCVCVFVCVCCSVLNTKLCMVPCMTYTLYVIYLVCHIPMTNSYSYRVVGSSQGCDITVEAESAIQGEWVMRMCVYEDVCVNVCMHECV